MNVNTREVWEVLPDLNETRFSSSLIVLGSRYMYCIASSIVSEIKSLDDERDKEFENYNEENELQRISDLIKEEVDEAIKQAGIEQKYFGKKKVREMEKSLEAKYMVEFDAKKVRH